MPLSAIATDFVKQRRLARAKKMPEFREKILQDAKRLGLVSKEFQPTKIGPGRPALEFDEYLRVAEIYASATRDGLDPLQAIMSFKGHEMSKSNAGKMIYKCRHIYGLLELTTKGKPSGLTPKAIG